MDDRDIEIAAMRRVLTDLIVAMHAAAPAHMEDARTIADMLAHDPTIPTSLVPVLHEQRRIYDEAFAVLA